MGLEYITQPQVFLAPITAVNGIQGINNPYPLLTTYQSWVSTGTVDTSAFPIPGTWTMLDDSGSFIVTVGNVIQSPTDYSIDRNNRILTFSSIITAGVEVGATQLATAAPSAIFYKNLTAENLFVYDTAFINNISLSSGSIIGGDGETVFSDGNIFTGNGSNTLTLNYLNGVFASSNFTVTSGIRCTSLTATNTSLTSLTAGNALFTSLTATGVIFSGLSATNATATSLSSRFINLEHSTPNDGVNPVLFIGERGDGSGGTIINSLSGFNTTYNEVANSLIVSTRFGTVTPLTAVSINSTGNVGIGTDRPGNRLTVVGDVSASGNVVGYNSTIYYHATGFGASPLTITPYFSAAAASIVLDPFRRYRLNIEAFYTKAAGAGAVTFTLSGTVPFVYATGSLVHSIGTGYTAGSGVPIHTAAVATSAATLAFSPGNIGGAGVTNHYGSFTYYIETSSVPSIANLFVTTALGGAINPGRGSYWQEAVIG